MSRLYPRTEQHAAKSAEVVLMASPSKPIEPSQKEVWSIERYKASQLPAILRAAAAQKLTGSVILNLSGGNPVNLEVKTKVSNGNGSTPY
jgi:hypothetical protein